MCIQISRFRAENLSNRRESEIFPSYFEHSKEKLLLTQITRFQSLLLPVAIFERMYIGKQNVFG